MQSTRATSSGKPLLFSSKKISILGLWCKHFHLGFTEFFSKCDLDWCCKQKDKILWLKRPKVSCELSRLMLQITFAVTGNHAFKNLPDANNKRHDSDWNCRGQIIMPTSTAKDSQNKNLRGRAYFQYKSLVSSHNCQWFLYCLSRFGQLIDWEFTWSVDSAVVVVCLCQSLNQ